jgi:anaerobic magnesium-protoporphyrin IX monomethyl ester cyclase
LQKVIRKNLNIEKAVLTINASVKAGIYSTGFFMLGLPTETFDEASDTVEFAANSLLHRAFFFKPIPFVGTDLADMVLDSQKKDNDNVSAHDASYYKNTLNISAMSDGELQIIFRRAYRSFYFKPQRMLKLLFYHPNVFSLLHYAFLTLIRILPRRRNLL